MRRISLLKRLSELVNLNLQIYIYKRILEERCLYSINIIAKKNTDDKMHLFDYLMGGKHKHEKKKCRFYNFAIYYLNFQF